VTVPRPSAPFQSAPNSVLVTARKAVQTGAMLQTQSLKIDAVRVPVKRMKTLEPDKVQALAEDILEHGQITPIRVRKDGDGFVLVEGLHRLKALEALGEDSIQGYLVQARLF